MTILRAAREDEDEVLARLLYNAFRLNWCTNWEHNLSISLPELQPITHEIETITGASAARLASWRATLSLTRKLGGRVDVAVAVAIDGESLAAVSCFLPPGIKPGFIALLMSGYLLVPLRMGLCASYRFRKNHLLAQKLWRSALKSLDERLETGACFLAVGTNPTHAGNGYAFQLLQWQIEKHRSKFPSVPVYLETASDHAQRVYERLGFEETARGQVHLRGVDQNGLKLPKRSGVANETEKLAEPYFALRCMRLPPN